MPSKRLGWQAQVETTITIYGAELEPSQRSGVRARGIVMALVAAVVLAAVAAYAVPRAAEMLAGMDDPARIAHHALNDKFNAGGGKARDRGGTRRRRCRSCPELCRSCSRSGCGSRSIVVRAGECRDRRGSHHTPQGEKLCPRSGQRRTGRYGSARWNCRRRSVCFRRHSRCSTRRNAAGKRTSSR